MARKTIKKAFLVYQAGIANLFHVNCLNLSSFGRNAKRILQSDFRSCENMARGLQYAGWIVKVAHCNKAGDITEQHWSESLGDAPFRENFRFQPS